MRKRRFWNNLHCVRSKPTYLKVFGSKQTNGPKQYCHNHLWSDIHEGGYRQCYVENELCIGTIVHIIKCSSTSIKFEHTNK